MRPSNLLRFPVTLPAASKLHLQEYHLPYWLQAGLAPETILRVTHAVAAASGGSLSDEGKPYSGGFKMAHCTRRWTWRHSWQHQHML